MSWCLIGFWKFSVPTSSNAVVPMFPHLLVSVQLQPLLRFQLHLTQSRTFSALIWILLRLDYTPVHGFSLLLVDWTHLLLIYDILLFNSTTSVTGTRELARWLRAHVAFVEEQSFVHRTHVRGLTTKSRGFWGHLRGPGVSVHNYTQTYAGIFFCFYVSWFNLYHTL